MLLMATEERGLTAADLAAGLQVAFGHDAEYAFLAVRQLPFDYRMRQSEFVQQG